MNLAFMMLATHVLDDNQQAHRWVLTLRIKTSNQNQQWANIQFTDTWVDVYIYTHHSYQAKPYPYGENDLVQVWCALELRLLLQEDDIVSFCILRDKSSTCHFFALTFFQLSVYSNRHDTYWCASTALQFANGNLNKSLNIKTRWSPRTRMLTRMLMVQMSKHMVMQWRTIPFCNSLFEQSCTCFPCYQSAVWSGKCRVWSLK